MQVLIKSNPYEQVIVYQYRRDENEVWEEIVEGELFSDEYKKGFFPFIVEKVLDAIIKQFRNDDQGKIDLIFAGPDDEYSELEQAVGFASYLGNPYYEYINIKKSPIILYENNSPTPTEKVWLASSVPVCKLS